jgi:hypothetical protein
MRLTEMRSSPRRRLQNNPVRTRPRVVLDVAAGPALSIIVIPLVGHDALANCLDRLPLTTVECIVVLREAMGAIGSWEKRYPSVTFLAAVHQPVPLRRHCGLRFATGEVVGLIEDTSWPDEDWCTATRSVFADPQTAAAGGPVRIAAGLPNRYRALGSSEYGAFLVDRHSRATNRSSHEEVSRVPGNNMAFRRADLIDVLSDDRSGLFEGRVCARLLAKGRRIVYHPRMSVTYAVCDRHNAALATRLHHGRIYAAAQVEDRPWISRLVHLAKVPLLPIVLTSRAIGSLHGSGGLRARLPILFWLSLMESAWALGEAVGALAGAGRSINEWR